MSRWPVIANVVGLTIIIVGTVMHIVSLSSPYWVGVDPSRVKASDLYKNKASSEQGDTSPHEHFSPRFSRSISDAPEAAIDVTSIRSDYGLWEICSTMGNLHKCQSWSEVAGNSVFKIPGWLNAAQVMAILGLVAAVVSAVLTFFHLYRHSQGDRLRLLPIFICISCCVQGFFILCGDIIVATKYSEITHVDNAQARELLKQMSYLQWGFIVDVVSSVLVLLAGVLLLITGRIYYYQTKNGVV